MLWGNWLFFNQFELFNQVKLTPFFYLCVQWNFWLIIWDICRLWGRTWQIGSGGFCGVCVCSALSLAGCSVGIAVFSLQSSLDTGVCSHRSVPQDMLTGKIWLSISQLNWECTCHSLLDKLRLAPVHQASELWKPLMDEIWTSIFLSSRLLNKLLLKFAAMFADMCFRECSCFPALLCNLLRRKIISLKHKASWNVRIFYFFCDY